MLKSALIAKLSSEKRKKPVQNGSAKHKSSKTKPKKSALKLDGEALELSEKFHIDPNCIKTGVEGLIKFTTENPKLKNQLFDDEEFPIFLQVNSIKVPETHSKILRFPLKHSIFKENCEVCLIVADVKGIPNKNHDEHKEVYEKLLQEKGVDCIKQIMTFHEFRSEYDTFEMKSRLVELYDVFLADGKIGGKVVGRCGKIFYKKRKIPITINMKATKLKKLIDAALKKTALYLHSKSDSFTVQVGHSKMDTKQLIENVLFVIKGLDKGFPGGFKNVRSLNLFAHRGLRMPIYASLKDKKDIKASLNVKKNKIPEPVTGEISTRLNAGVTVKPTGEVEVYKLKDHKKIKTGSSEDIDEEENEEIVEKTSTSKKHEKTKSVSSMQIQEKEEEEENDVEDNNGEEEVEDDNDEEVEEDDDDEVEDDEDEEESDDDYAEEEIEEEEDFTEAKNPKSIKAINSESEEDESDAEIIKQNGINNKGLLKGKSYQSLNGKVGKIKKRKPSSDLIDLGSKKRKVAAEKVEKENLQVKVKTSKRRNTKSK